MNSIKFKVSGLVQGVFFRKYTREKALELGLSGWVRNMPNGSVEGLAQGEAEALDTFVDWLWTGSPQSSVALVEKEKVQVPAEKGFEIRY